jgi:hypothetical protein
LIPADRPWLTPGITTLDVKLAHSMEELAARQLRK